MPTGHQVIQRPHPTHPNVPNWSTHDESLCTIHWRYRALGDRRKFPPVTFAKSIVKQESQRRHRSARSPLRSVTSSTVEQKHVGQTNVQLEHIKHRRATSSQCALSRLSARSSLSPSVFIALPMFVLAASTSSPTASTSLASA